MNASARHGDVGFLIIGGAKLATALGLALVGFGVFRLMDRDLGEFLESWVTRLHLDPENRAVHFVVYQAAGIDRAHLKAIGAGTFFYSLLEFVEGTGLLLRRRWAEYLTIVATALLLPVEVYEIAIKPSAVRAAVFAGNVAVVIYLVVKVAKSAPGHEPRPTDTGL